MKDPQQKITTAIKGAAGEHYVASYLSGHGLVVAMPRAGIPGCDMLIADSKHGKALRIQVKTGTQSTKKHKELGPIYLWRSSIKIIERKDPNLWYAFVSIKGWPQKGEPPEIFFVPSRVVVRCLKDFVGTDGEAEGWPCFWMKAKAIQKYKGELGFSFLSEALK